MSLRTTALPEDFQYFEAWFGQCPRFDFMLPSSCSSSRTPAAAEWKLSCADEWFLFRVASINAWYLPRVAHLDTRFTQVWFRGLEDLASCYRVKRIGDPHMRMRAWRQRFARLYPRNDVWEYREVPRNPLLQS
eukprot:GHVU01224250.1.p1 GENE.GHVU01224250.1~~GHVU01224250.1.p1  ORF type:complete len:133 (-),score=9.59 GHVU01224250.1:331-729(-)